MFNLFKKNKSKDTKDNIEKRIKCPKCKKWMDKIISKNSFSQKKNNFVHRTFKKENSINQDVIIDVCPYCGGMFLDRDEVARLVNLTRKSNPKEKKLNTKKAKSNSKKSVKR